MNWPRLQRSQRTVRQARQLLVAAKEASPEIADELAGAVEKVDAAERKAARLLREELVSR